VLRGLPSGPSEATIWGEYIHAPDAEVIATFGSGALEGWPAITRRASGGGTAWYIGTQLTGTGFSDLLDRVLGEAAVAGVLATPVDGVEAVRRSGRLFLINHRDDPVTVDGIALEGRGVHIGEN
jgi:beta-galactosidase